VALVTKLLNGIDERLLTTVAVPANLWAVAGKVRDASRPKMIDRHGRTTAVIGSDISRPAFADKHARNVDGGNSGLLDVRKQ
jgi:hypothetical protein